MTSPLPPYPIPPPQMPTIEKIFRKEIVTTVQAPVSPPSHPTLAANTDIAAITEIPPSSSASTNSKGGKDKTSKKSDGLPLSETNQHLEVSSEEAKTAPKKKTRDLPPPPDISNLKPLEKVQLSAPEPSPLPVTPVIAPIITTVEYIDIPLEQPLSRAEAVEVVSTSVSSAMEEYKQWVLQKLQWEEGQWAERTAALQKARSDRDADIALQKAKEKPKQAEKPAGAGKQKK